MAMDEAYRRQVALLVQTIPLVAMEACFALKGGTAINLFIRDMPRLSVDIDLTYLPVKDRRQSLNEIDGAMNRLAKNIERSIPGAKTTLSILQKENCATKVFVDAEGTRIKIEVTPVLRGCGFDAETKSVSSRVGRHRMRRLMGLMDLESIYQAPRTSMPHPAHRVYPYLHRRMVIDRPNRVWFADITYIPVQRGFLYLVAIMDWATRHVLSWWLNTMDAKFCVAALADALARYATPEIFNTDQGSQFTSFDFTGVLKDAGVTISMDSWGRCTDNIFIERLWRSPKYEAVYLHELTDGFKAGSVIGDWIDFYNTERPHSVLAGQGLRGRAARGYDG